MDFFGGLNGDEFFANRGIDNIVADVKRLESYIARGSTNNDVLRKWVEDRKDWLRRVGAAW